MKNKPIFMKFLEAMNYLSNEVNDREICKRLETLMLTSKDDLNATSVENLLKDPPNFDPKEIPEPYTMYVKHFIYMVKRNDKLGVKKHNYEDYFTKPAPQNKPTKSVRKTSSRGVNRSKQSINPPQSTATGVVNKPQST